MSTDWPTIDAAFPYRGPCAFCGGPDARHRLFDALRGRHRAGDSVELLAADYALSLEAVRAVLAPKRCPSRRRLPDARREPAQRRQRAHVVEQRHAVDLERGGGEGERRQQS